MTKSSARASTDGVDTATLPPMTSPEPRNEARPHLELSAAQIGTGVAAAVTTALLGSTLGVAGTVVGAGVGSAISITAGALYSHSIAATKHRLHRTRGGAVPGAPSAPAAAKPSPSAIARPPATGSTRGVRWRGVLAGALGTAVAFTLALVVITGLESVKGAPLAGGGQGGLSVLGGGSIGQADRDRPGQVPPSTTDAESTDSVNATDAATATNDGGDPTGPAASSTDPRGSGSSATTETATVTKTVTDSSVAETTSNGTSDPATESGDNSDESTSTGTTAPANSSESAPTAPSTPAPSAPNATNPLNAPDANTSIGGNDQ